MAIAERHESPLIAGFFAETHMIIANNVRDNLRVACRDAAFPTLVLGLDEYARQP